jgi:hypothetical protein
MFIVRSSREFRDVGEQFLGSGYVEFSTGQHEVGLRVHFPQNQIQRYHAISLGAPSSALIQLIQLG